MSISFTNLIEKMKARLRPAPPPTPIRAAPLEKPSSEKLAKTVMPNATRTIAPLDPFEVASGAAPRSTSRPAQRSVGLPPAVAVALEPKVERTIALQLSDIVAEIPPDYLKPAGSYDVNRRVLLKASEIEKGMAIGKPAASLTAIYEQIPEIFVRSIPHNEMMQVPLPLAKVLEQFTTARVRGDQERDQAVPQVDTPILQATIEDTERFGTSIAPIETSAEPPVKVEPASARALAEAEPETMVRKPSVPVPPVAPPPPPARPVDPIEPRTRSTIRVTIPLSPETQPASPPVAKTPPNPPNEPSKPAKISIELPPNGTDEPATERVPASSGPSVPIRVKPPTPTPPKVTPPCADLLKPKLTLVPGMESKAEPAEEDFNLPLPKKSKRNEPKISLPLRPILETIPPFQLNGSPSTVPDDTRVEFPLSLIQPQLAIGRVVVSPRVFQNAMPRQFRELIVLDNAETPVQLPLQEVLKNIPQETLQMRGDQVEAERGEDFETPFSIKAKEDAKLFQSSATPIAKTEAPEATAEKPDKIDNVEAPMIDAKEVVSRASALEGVAGCVVTFADGLSLAGNLPDDMAVGGLCAVAPSLLQRIHQHMFETNLGPLNAMTLHGNKSAITFFSHGNVYLTVLHGRTQLGDETYNKLAGLTKELARTYALPGKH
jgi:predicted regulator of Ras-like GTPase activity (Roadblock/LC7/MglB family)